MGLDDNPLMPDGEINILAMKPLDSFAVHLAFDHALTAAADRLALVQLREGLQEAQNRYRVARARAMPAERYVVLERNIRTLGFRMLRVQTKLSAIREARRQNAEDEDRVRDLQATGKGEDSLPEMFQSVAAELLSPETYDQLLEAARARLERRRKSV